VTQTQRIVVGVDDSGGARAALAWALDEARRHQARITLVHAFLLEVAWIDRADMARWSDLQRRAAETALAQIVDDVSPPAGVEVDARVVEGNPVNVLIDASQDADLLVVGSRGRGGLAGVLLGSVSQRCVERAHCPVVVIPTSG
jgi:nucleotide-binding universal stress UspA family protein